MRRRICLRKETKKHFSRKITSDIRNRIYTLTYEAVFVISTVHVCESIFKGAFTLLKKKIIIQSFLFTSIRESGLCVYLRILSIL